MLTQPPTRELALPDVQHAIQERTRRDDHRARREHAAIQQLDAAHAATLRTHALHHALDELQVRRRIEQRQHLG